MRLLSKIAITLIAIQVAINLLGLTSFGWAGDQPEFINLHNFENNASSLRPNSNAGIGYLEFAGWSMQTSVTFIFDILWSAISGGTIESLVMMFDPTGQVLTPFAVSLRLLVVGVFVLAVIEYIRG